MVKTLLLLLLLPLVFRGNKSPWAQQALLLCVYFLYLASVYLGGIDLVRVSP